MATVQETYWSIEPHTQIKNLILRRYLDAWLPIMARHNGRILSVDGFAGPGRYRGGEEGSPIIALKALLDHPHFQRSLRQREVVFRFIEREEDRAAALQDELRRFEASRPIPEWVKYDVLQGEFAPLMTQVLDKLESESKQLAPSFTFIDPFGFAGVPIEVITRIVQNPHCECLITFMSEAVNRFISHPDPKIQTHINQLFGTEEWRTVMKVSDPARRRYQIVDLYRRQLAQEARLRYVRTFEMINRGNRTEYFLYFEQIV
ncbi:MAG: three-Cys-motif partner protein TcmP [Candidatus Binatia bacterium]